MSVKITKKSVTIIKVKKLSLVIVIYYPLAMLNFK